MIRIRIKVKSRIRIRIKGVWIRNTALERNCRVSHGKKVHSDLEEEELPVCVHSVEGLVAAVLCDGLRDVQDIIVGHRSGRT